MLTPTEVTHADYARLFPRPSVVYNSVDFSLLNASKVELLHFVTLNDDSGVPLFGITLGEREGRLLSPFSAPFGGLETTHPHSVERWLEAAEALKSIADDERKTVVISLPPEFYQTDDTLVTQALVLQTVGFKDTPDYNFHFPQGDITLSRAARKNLNTSRRHPLNVSLTPSLSRAYAVIKANRASHGYPLKMTQNQVAETSRIIPADFWIVSLDTGADVAAAIVFDVTERVVQVIYWGDIEEYSHMRPMNLLAAELSAYYASRGKIVDVGPSSSDGIPSVGLCRFKASVGCRLSAKHVLSLSPS